MTAWAAFNSFLSKPFDCYFRQTTPPSASSYWVLLTNGGTIDATVNLATVLAQEVSGFGYARKACNFSAGSYDSGQIRFEYPPVTLTWTASGGAIAYDKAILVAGTTITGTTGELVLFYAEPSAVTIAAGTSRTITLPFNIGGSAANVDAA